MSKTLESIQFRKEKGKLEGVIAWKREKNAAEKLKGKEGIISRWNR